MIKNEVINSKQLYRQIFLKVQDEFFKLTDDLKENYFCNNCKKCCELVYINKTPQEINILVNSNNNKNLFLNEFKNYFLPYGYSTWQYNDFDHVKNFDEAKSAFPEEVKLIKMFENNAVFYHLKNNYLEKGFNKSEVFEEYPFKVLTVLHKDCAYNNWQHNIISYLKNDLSRQVYQEITKIDQAQIAYKCNRTGTCCRLSTSEYSYKDLLTKAENGDSFAKQFVSIFVPYENEESAREIFPEFVDYVKNELGKDENVYFYHCPHINEENLCTIYTSDKRPNICSDFPNNPLTILYPTCGYCGWKEEVLTSAMSCHAMIEILTYTIDKLETITMLRSKN